MLAAEASAFLQQKESLMCLHEKTIAELTQEHQEELDEQENARKVLEERIQ